MTSGILIAVAGLQQPGASVHPLCGQCPAPGDHPIDQVDRQQQAVGHEQHKHQAGLQRIVGPPYAGVTEQHQQQVDDISDPVQAGDPGFVVEVQAQQCRQYCR